MGLIPKRKQLSKFADESPILSLLYIGFIGFTVVDMMSSFSLPRGKGPFSPKAANLGAYSPNYMTAQLFRPWRKMLHPSAVKSTPMQRCLIGQNPRFTRRLTALTPLRITCLTGLLLVMSPAHSKEKLTKSRVS